MKRIVVEDCEIVKVTDRSRRAGLGYQFATVLCLILTFHEPPVKLADVLFDVGRIFRMHDPVYPRTGIFPEFPEPFR